MAAATETLEGFEQAEAFERISVALAAGAKVIGRAA